MRNKLMDSKTFNQPLDMVYITNDWVIKKRRIRVVQIGNDHLRASCDLRKSKRTFKIENILALVIVKEIMVI